MAFCSTSSTEVPCRLISAMTSPIWPMIRGARPSDGSSSSSSFGLAISARPMASICCSPPDSSAAALRAALLEHREQVVDPVLGPRLRRLVLAAHAAGAQVLLHREPAEDPPALGDLHQAHADDLRRVAAAEVGAVEADRARLDPAAVQPQGAGDGAQQRRLAGPVAAEDGDDLAVGDLHGHAAHRLDGAAVGHVERFDAQHGQHFLSATSIDAGGPPGGDGTPVTGERGNLPRRPAAGGSRPWACLAAGVGSRPDRRAAVTWPTLRREL